MQQHASPFTSPPVSVRDLLSPHSFQMWPSPADVLVDSSEKLVVRCYDCWTTPHVLGQLKSARRQNGQYQEYRWDMFHQESASAEAVQQWIDQCLELLRQALQVDQGIQSQCVEMQGRDGSFSTVYAWNNHLQRRDHEWTANMLVGVRPVYYTCNKGTICYPLITSRAGQKRTTQRIQGRVWFSGATCLDESKCCHSFDHLPALFTLLDCLLCCSGDSLQLQSLDSAISTYVGQPSVSKGALLVFNSPQFSILLLHLSASAFSQHHQVCLHQLEVLCTIPQTPQMTRNTLFALLNQAWVLPPENHLYKQQKSLFLVCMRLLKAALPSTVGQFVSILKEKTIQHDQPTAALLSKCKDNIGVFLTTALRLCGCELPCIFLKNVNSWHLSPVLTNYDAVYSVHLASFLQLRAVLYKQHEALAGQTLIGTKPPYCEVLQTPIKKVRVHLGTSQTLLDYIAVLQNTQFSPHVLQYSILGKPLAPLPALLLLGICVYLIHAKLSFQSLKAALFLLHGVLLRDSSVFACAEFPEYHFSTVVREDKVVGSFQDQYRAFQPPGEVEQALDTQQRCFAKCAEDELPSEMEALSLESASLSEWLSNPWSLSSEQHLQIQFSVGESLISRHASFSCQEPIDLLAVQPTLDSPALQAYYMYSALVYYIHPFEDGNGRLARLLGNCILAKAGQPWYLVHTDKLLTYKELLQRTHRKHT